MSTRLARLRDDLARLQNTRQMIRHVSGIALLIQSLMLILVLAFVCDWLLDMSAAQRIILLGLMALAFVWSIRRFVRPWFGQADDPVELALSVEQRQGIDSDLVSALQFESPEAAQWGSTQLEGAVISHVAELSPKLNVFEGLSYDDFRRRLILLAVAVLVPLSAAAVFPGYFTAFVNRMVLGAATYPTDTQIVEFSVNGEVVTRGQSVIQPVVSSPIGHPVRFDIRWSGEEPASDSRLIHLRSLEGDVSTEVELARLEASPPEGMSIEIGEPMEGRSGDVGTGGGDGDRGDGDATTGAASAADTTEGGAADPATQNSDSPREASPLDANPSDTEPSESPRPASNGSAWSLRGELPRLMSSVSIQARIGDARTRKITIEAIPLPVIETEMKVTPPEYARGQLDSSPDHAGSQRVLSVLEGSRVDLTVRSLNKPLDQAELRIGDETYQLVPQDEAQREWTLDVGGTALDRITEPVRYQITARDRRGLELESPVHGAIRLRSDQPPRVAISVRTRKVIPSATPLITWSASDDFGVNRVTARVQVSRASGTTDETEAEVVRNPDVPKTSLEGQWDLDLSELELIKGDEVKVTFAAADFRGDAEPVANHSEPVMLQVTDRQGILSGLLETDEESARQLDAIIRRELGIGESK